MRLIFFFVTSHLLAITKTLLRNFILRCCLAFSFAFQFFLCLPAKCLFTVIIRVFFLLLVSDRSFNINGFIHNFFSFSAPHTLLDNRKLIKSMLVAIIGSSSLLFMLLFFRPSFWRNIVPFISINFLSYDIFIIS